MSSEGVRWESLGVRAVAAWPTVVHRRGGACTHVGRLADPRARDAAFSGGSRSGVPRAGPSCNGAARGSSGVLDVLLSLRRTACPRDWRRTAEPGVTNIAAVRSRGLRPESGMAVGSGSRGLLVVQRSVGRVSSAGWATHGACSGRLAAERQSAGECERCGGSRMPAAAGWRGQPVAREAIQIGCVRSLRVGFSDCSRPFDAACARSAPLGRKHASLAQAGGWPVWGYPGARWSVHPCGGRASAMRRRRCFRLRRNEEDVGVQSPGRGGWTAVRKPAARSAASESAVSMKCRVVPTVGPKRVSSHCCVWVARSPQRSWHT